MPFRYLPFRRLRRSTALAALVLAVAVPVVLAATVSAPVTTSRPSPFAACTDGASPDGEIFINSEPEPWIDVNPTNGDNVIGVWQADRWTDGGAHSNDTAYSTNGGATWSYPTPISWSTCSGSTNPDYNRATDPWVSFGPTGIAYQVALSFDGDGDGFTGAVLASRSTDGGAHWSSPVVLVDDNDFFIFHDKESVTADPTDASLIYAVWDKIEKPGANRSLNAAHSFAFRGTPMLARSTNGGLSWEAARSIAPTNANIFTIGNQIVVQPDGTLVDFFEYFKGSGVQPSTQHWNAILTSEDHGVTWSRVTTIDKVFDVANTIPDGSFPVRAGSNDVAVDPTSGDLYAVWTDARFSDGTHNDIVLSKSTDDGQTWTAPAKVSQNPVGLGAHTPSVHVNADGDVAVTYYDFRNQTAAAGVETDFWIEISTDGGSTWSESRLTASSFDITTAPVAPASRGYFLGDYEGLSSFESTFYVLYVVTTGDPTDRTDVVFQTVTP